VDYPYGRIVFPEAVPDGTSDGDLSLPSEFEGTWAMEQSVVPTGSMPLSGQDESIVQRRRLTVQITRKEEKIVLAQISSRIRQFEECRRCSLTEIDGDGVRRNVSIQ